MYHNGDYNMDFKSQASCFLEAAEFFREGFPDQVLNISILNSQTKYLAFCVISDLIRDIKYSSQENYTTKEISAQTGIEEWKLRKYIASEKLKAESNKSSDGNPGRSGYSISKEDLIYFIKENSTEIAYNQKSYESFVQTISNIILTMEKFIARVDPLIELGNLELELAEIDQTEEKRAIIEKKILLQKLKIEKQFFEEKHKYFVQALQNPTAENSTEQTPETK